MVLMATDVADPRVHTLGLMDMTVDRNAFGRQRESFEADIPVTGLDGGPFHAIFIRAPVVTAAGAGVHVLATLDQGIVAAEKKEVHGACLPPGAWRGSPASRTVFAESGDLTHDFIIFPPKFMGMRQDTADIKEQVHRFGADFVGIADAAGFLNPGYTGNRPQDFMPGIRSVIVIGVVIPKGCVQPLPKGRPEYTNTLMAGTATLRVIAFRLARDLEKQGYLAALVPTEGSEFGMWYADRETLRADISLSMPHGFGLGATVSTSCSSPANRPRIRMTAILTDAPLDADQPTEKIVRPECTACQRCVKVCPVGAILADGTIRPQACRDFMFSTLGGLRCGMCIRVCRLNGIGI